MWGVPFYLFGFAPFLFLQTAKVFDPLEEGCFLLNCVCCSLLLISKANQLVGLTSPHPFLSSILEYFIFYPVVFVNCI